MHGDADLFVSSKNPYPNSESSSEYTSKRDSSVDRIDIDGDSLKKGPVWIGVKGYKQSTFKVEVRLKYSDSSEWYVDESFAWDQDYFLLS